MPVFAMQAAKRDSVFVVHRSRLGLIPVTKQQRPNRASGWTIGIQNAEEIETEAKEQALSSIPANLGGAESPASARAPIRRPRTRA